jgi:hypothetical protein
MDKIDLKKQLKQLYGARANAVSEVEVPTLRFLMIDGRGDPNTTPLYRAAVEALFALSYTIKFMIKSGAAGIDYTVLPLEGLWWADDMSCFTAADRSQWKWTMMIMQPECVTASIVERATDDTAKKKRLEALGQVRYASLAEGRCAQTLHVGPFTEEGPTIARVHDYIARSGLRLSGKHHEIYLSDIRRVEPNKWRTIIRQPMG